MVTKGKDILSLRSKRQAAKARGEMAYRFGVPTSQWERRGGRGVEKFENNWANTVGRNVLVPLTSLTFR